MEPRDAELKKAVDPCPAERNPRFRIVKLEERITPNKGGVPNGGNDWGYYKPCHGAHGKCFP